MSPKNSGRVQETTCKFRGYLWGFSGFKGGF